MTDNEKAATFIRWVSCPNPSWRYDNATYTFTCFGCGRIDPDAKHPPEPDMTDPRNYMKALESLRNVLPGFYLSDGDGWVADFRVQNSDPKSEWGTDEWIKFSGNDRKYANFAECAVGTLAALYDAEHA